MPDSPREKIENSLNITPKEVEAVINKAREGGEISSDEELDQWVEERFLPNSVLLSKEKYSQMCINALRIVNTLAATDYGSSRQRDFGQLWADVIRGYLGEVAFLEFLNKHWGIQGELAHEQGELSQYIPMDIHKIKRPGQEPTAPKLSIGIKTSKWSGIWLDIPGSQFSSSDIHVFVKIGIERDHLFAFFKDISVFKEKILKIGVELGAITDKESKEIFQNLPTFKPVAAYICGFIRKDQSFNELSYSGKRGRKHYTITAWNGPIRSGDLEKIKEKEKTPGTVKFSGIGSFSHDVGYLFNTGNLLWQKKDWNNIISSL